MNRKQKRDFLRSLKGYGYTKQQKLNILEARIKTMYKGTFVEGEKVKLKYDEIIAQPSYETSLDGYKKTVEKLKDKELTVVYDSKYTNNPTLVCLEEDDSELKWLFWTGHLERV